MNLLTFIRLHAQFLVNFFFLFFFLHWYCCSRYYRHIQQLFICCRRRWCTYAFFFVYLREWCWSSTKHFTKNTRRLNKMNYVEVYLWSVCVCLRYRHFNLQWSETFGAVGCCAYSHLRPYTKTFALCRNIWDILM